MPTAITPLKNGGEFERLHGWHVSIRFVSSGLKGHSLRAALRCSKACASRPTPLVWHGAQRWAHRQRVPGPTSQLLQRGGGTTA